MPELDSMTIQGFKSIANVDGLKLRSINVVVGPNGSGKSNFIGVFGFLHAIREGRLQDYVTKAGGASRILHFGPRVTKALHIKISFANKTNEYEITLEPTDADELIPTKELVYYWDRRYPRPYDEGLARIGKEAGISNPKYSKVANYVRDHLDRWRVYHFHDTSASSPIKSTADVNDNRFLRPDGANLAAFLFFLRAAHPSEYSLIRRTVARIAPFFDDFVLEPMRLNENRIRLEWKHKNSDSYFDASSMSDGTIRFVALATLFLQPKDFRPSVILVDEPELGLHPYAITLLASLAKQASLSTQVILSTQSPLLLDHFAPEDVLVADRVDGGTHFSRLDPTKLNSWLENYSLGQLWEKNELGGRPKEN
jgi:predicted ATPase